MKELLLIAVGSALVNNVVLSQFLGLCPFLGVSKKVETAAGMGAAVIFVITIASAVTYGVYAAFLRPDGLIGIDLTYLQTIVFILVIAALVQFVEMFLKKNMVSQYESLGVYLSLIVVNCIILGRAEMFANKNTVLDSALDGVGMGLGFTLALTAMAVIREVFGSGTFCGMPIPWLSDNPISILSMAPGGFCIFGCMIALVNKLTKGRKVRAEGGCAGCPAAASCKGKECESK